MKVKQIIAIILVLALAFDMAKVYSLSSDMLVILVIVGFAVSTIADSFEGFTGAHAAMDADAFHALNAIVKAIATSENGGTLVIPANLKVLGKLTLAHNNDNAVLQLGDDNAANTVKNATFTVSSTGDKAGFVQTSNAFTDVALAGNTNAYMITSNSSTQSNGNNDLGANKQRN